MECNFVVFACLGAAESVAVAKFGGCEVIVRKPDH